MTYNLFIAYDLMSPGQNYDAVQNAIKQLGKWHQFQYSLFYVSSALAPREAANAIMAHMDSNDRLAVIEAKGGVCTTWDRPPLEAINDIWFSP